jgi:hypothetical protein
MVVISDEIYDNNNYYYDLIQQFESTLNTSNMNITVKAGVIQTSITYRNVEVINYTNNMSGLLIDNVISSNILHIYDGTNSNIVFTMLNNGNIGINKEASNYTIDINGITNAINFKGNSKYLSNVNLNDRTTSLLKEGSNLYYTFERVIKTFNNYIKTINTSRIPEGSNIYYIDIRYTDVFNSNIYLKTTDDVKEGSNLYYTEERTDKRIKENRPALSYLTTSVLKEGSNIYYKDDVVDDLIHSATPSISAGSTSILPEGSNLYYTDIDIKYLINKSSTSQYIEGSSNLYYETPRVYNDFDNKIFNKTTDNLIQGTSNLYYTDEIYDLKFSLKTTDDLMQGTNYKYIIDDVYNDSLIITQALTTSNLNVVGSNVILYTPVYITENVELINQSFSHSLVIKQVNTDLYRILDIKDDDNEIFIIDNSNINNVMNIGIKNNNPLYDLDVNEKINSKFFKGDGQYLSNINLNNSSTSHLKEDSNLYYTQQRINDVFDNKLTTKTTNNLLEGSSNLYYTDDRTIILFENRFLIKSTSQLLEGSNLYSTIKRLNDIFDNKLTTKSTNNLLEGTSNIYYTLERVDNAFDIRLSNKTTSQLTEGSNLYYTIIRNINDFDNRLSTKTTDNLLEGNSNIYFTTERIYNNFDNRLNTKTTSQLVEGSNIYYTQKRINNLIDERLTTKDTNNLFEGNSNIYYTQNRTNNDLYTNLSYKTTSHLLEGSNIYYTIHRDNNNFDIRLNTKTTNNLLEGSSNIYYTIIRSYDNFDNRLNIKNTSQLKEGSNLYYTSIRNENVFDNSLNSKSTDNLLLGTSNIYYDNLNFDNDFNKKTTDNLKEGINNRYIVNDVYNGDMYILNDITTSNLNIIGSNILIKSITNIHKNLNIFNNTINDTLNINSTNGIKVSYNDNVSLIIDNNKVGINTINPIYDLDVNGNIKAIYFKGDGSTIYNINISDKSTSHLTEGSNEYYTSSKFNNHFDSILSSKSTSQLIEGSNIYYVNNYIYDIFDIKLNNTETSYLNEGSNLYYKHSIVQNDIHNLFNNKFNTITTDNIYENNNVYYTTNKEFNDYNNRFNTKSTSQLKEGSNLYYTDALIDARILVNVIKLDNVSTSVMKEGSNLYYTTLRVNNSFDNILNNSSTSQLREGSNLYYRIDKYTDDYNNKFSSKKTDNITQGLSNLYWDTNKFNTRLALKTSDNINQGIHNKYIIDDTYEGTLRVNSIIITSNLSVYNNLVNFQDTNTYSTENLNIENSDSNVCLIINHYTSNDILDFYKNTNIKMIMTGKNKIGINTSVPNYDLDVNNTIKALIFSGDAHLLSNINIIDISTSKLEEGSNLYYTLERINNLFDNNIALKTTSILPEGSNMYYLSVRLNNEFDAKILLKTTSELNEGSNLYYTTQQINTIYDTKLASKTTSELNEGSNIYYTLQRINKDFDNNFASKSTSLLNEGSNLYYITSRLNDDFDNKFSLKTTSQISEGSNLYYNTSRLNTDFDNRIIIKNTTNINEGSNLYYTTFKLNDDFDNKLATKTTSQFSEGSNIYYKTSLVNTVFDNRLITKTTSQLDEGINLYYTQNRLSIDFDNIILTKTTSQVKEGSNLYYRIDRVNSNIDGILKNKTTSQLLEDSNLYYNVQRNNTDFDNIFSIKTTSQLSEGSNLYYTQPRLNNDFDNILKTKTTSLISENTNLYYTTDRVRTLYNSKFYTKTTSELKEGSNLYYTTSRYNTAFDNRLLTKKTSVLLEGANLYYTTNRLYNDFDDRFAIKTINNFTEGSNLYYTTSRLYTDFDNRLKTKTTSQLIEDSNIYYTSSRLYSDFDDRLLTKTTSELREGSNLYYTTTRLNTDFDNRLKTRTTSQLVEDSNIYYTSSRLNTDFDNKLLTKTTSELREGSNLYYTTSRLNTDFDNRLKTKTTSQLIEDTNLYYTTLRVNDIFDNKLLTKTTSELREGSNLYYLTSRLYTDFDNRLKTKTTSQLIEDTNLYYTSSRLYSDFDYRLLTKTTTELKEGFNLYYTTQRLNTDFDNRLKTKTTSQLIEDSNIYYTTSRLNNDFDNSLLTKTTSQLSEGSNLYYTTLRLNNDFDNRLKTRTTSQLIEDSNLYYTNTRLVNIFEDKLLTKTTDNLNNNIISGSNVYYTSSQFNNSLSKISLDYIKQGAVNKYIINNIYNGILTITDNLFTSNLTVYGSNSVFETPVYITNKLEIVNQITGPALTIKQIGYSNILSVYKNNTNILSIVDNKIGIRKNIPDYEIDVSGTINATIFRGEASQLSNVNLNDRTTSLLKEGSNLYYTSSRLYSDFDDRLITKTTSQLKEGSNLYYITSRLYDDFDNRLKTKTTSQLSEGSNLYYTSQRLYNDFDDRLLTKTTSELREGSNLYYLTSRLNTDFDNRLKTKTTSQLIEDSNLYYTSQRLYSDFDDRLLTKTTSELKEGSNLYYITSRLNTDFDDRLKTKTTSQLVEDSNLYYTQSRVNDIFDNKLLTKTTSELREGSNLYYTTSRLNIDFDNRLKTKTTSQLIEGSNLYYTTQRVYNDFDDRLLIKTTNNLIEGSNLYYTTSRVNNDFDTIFNAKTTNNLSQGTSNVYMSGSILSVLFGQKDADYLLEGNINKYIVNDIYNGNLTVSNTLTTSNLYVIGTATTINSKTYILNKLTIENTNSNIPALYVKQIGTLYNPLSVYKNSSLLFNVTSSSNVAIKRTLASYSSLNNSGYLGTSGNLPNLNNAVIDNINYIRGDGSVSFNGTDQYVDLSTKISLFNLYNTQITTGLTISSWVKIPSQPIDSQGGTTSTSLQYFYGSYCSDGEYLLRQFPSKSTTSMNDLIQNMINNSSYKGIVVYDYTTYWEVSYIPSGTIQLVYSRRPNVATWGDAQLRHVYIHINRATADGVYVNQSYATIQSFTPVSPASLVELWKMSDNAVGTNPNNYIAIQKKAGTTTSLNFAINSSSYNATSKVVIDNTWHHIVWCISSTGVWSIYIDNTYINPSITALIPTNVSWTKMWMARPEFGGSYLLGNIDDFRIYNKVLSATEVGYLYNNNSFSLDTTNLPIWYEFNNKLTEKSIISLPSTYTLDVNGTMRAINLIGTGNTSNINLKDRTSSMITEGSNLYYTDDRTSNILNNYTSLFYNNTNDLKEESNLYYTSDRYSNVFENRFYMKTTDNLIEIKTTTGFNYTDYIIWYKFENNLLDSGPKGNHGINYGISFNTNPTYIRQGSYSINQYDNLNSATRYYKSGNSFNINSNGLTISFWAYTSIFSFWKTFVSFHGTGVADSAIYSIRITPAGNNNSMFIILGENYATTYILSNGFTLDSMNHYAIVFNYSPAKWDFYCNGILQTNIGPQQRGLGGSYPLMNNVTLWSKCSWDNYSINGYVDDLRIINKSLSQTDIISIYTNPNIINIPTSVLTLYNTPFNFDNSFNQSLYTSNTTKLAEGSNLYYLTSRLYDDFDTSLTTKTTSELKEGSNLYYLTTRTYNDFDNRLKIKTTSQLYEGSNLYLNDYNYAINFDKRIGDLNTDYLKEGTSNIYYTDTRFHQKFINNKSTNYLKEGTSNIYYTSSRVNDLIAQGFNNRTTDFLDENYMSSNLYYKSGKRFIDFDNRFKILSTDILREGVNNLYYNHSRADTEFSNILSKKSTDYLNEGSSNLYYSDARTLTSFSNIILNNYYLSTNVINNIYPADTYNIIDNKISITSASTDNLLEGSSNYYFTLLRAYVNFKNNLSLSNTDNLQEGSNNLYYIQPRLFTDFDTRFNVISTDFLVQGSSNIYYTTALFNSNYDEKIQTLSTQSNLYDIVSNLSFVKQDYMSNMFIYDIPSSNFIFYPYTQITVPKTIQCSDLVWYNIPAFTTSNSLEYVCLYSDIINSNILKGLLNSYTTSNIIKDIITNEDFFITTSNANVQIAPYITSNSLNNLLKQNDFINSNILINYRNSYTQSNTINNILLNNNFVNSNALSNILLDYNYYLYNMCMLYKRQYINIINNNSFVSNPYIINDSYSYINYSNLTSGSNSITFTKNTICDILLVGAGGGEIVYSKNKLLPKGTYTIDLNSDSIIKNSLNNIIFSAKSNYDNYIMYGLSTNIRIFNLTTHTSYSFSISGAKIDMYLQTNDKETLYIIARNNGSHLYKYDIKNNTSTYLCSLNYNGFYGLAFAFLNSDNTLLYYTIHENNGYHKTFYVDLTTFIITEIPIYKSYYTSERSENSFVISNNKKLLYYSMNDNTIEIINISNPNNIIYIGKVYINLRSYPSGGTDQWGPVYFASSISGLTISDDDRYVYVLTSVDIIVIDTNTNTVVNTAAIPGSPYSPPGAPSISGSSTTGAADEYISDYSRTNGITLYNGYLILINSVNIIYYTISGNNLSYTGGYPRNDTYQLNTATNTTIIKIKKTPYQSSNFSITDIDLTYSGSNGISGTVIIKYPNLDFVDTLSNVTFNNITVPNDIYTSNLIWKTSPYFITSNAIYTSFSNVLIDYVTSNNISNTLLSYNYLTSNMSINTLTNKLVPYLTSNTIDTVILNHTFLDSNIFFSSLSSNYENIITSSKMNEGSNLYYTSARLSNDINTKFINTTTSQLTEGSNLYYTDDRVIDNFYTRLGTKTTNNLIETYKVNFDNNMIGNPIIGTNLYERFGNSVSLSGDGNIMIVGSFYYEIENSVYGKVSFYKWNGIDWINTGEFIGEYSGDQFGNSVSISADGTTAIVGSHNYGGANNSTNLKGAIYYYKWENSLWIQKYKIEGYNIYDHFGYAVSISGDGNNVIIGANNFGNYVDPARFANGTGKVYFYRWDGTILVKINEFAGSKASEQLGTKVSISSDGSAALAGPSIGNYGYANLYIWDGTNWIIRSTVSGTISGESVGSSLSISSDGSISAIGAKWYTVPGSLLNRAGIVRFYKWNGVSWTKISEILGLKIYENIGHSVSISGDGTRVALGGNEYSVYSPQQKYYVGISKFYKWDGTTWIKTNEIIGTVENQHLGESVAISLNGNVKAVGIPRYNNYGAVRVYGNSKVLLYNYYYTSQLYNDIFDNNFNNLSTSIIQEGSNLYYSSNTFNNYFDTILTIKSTSQLLEGSNLYYTTQLRNIDFDTKFAKIITSHVKEGSNYYYTSEYLNNYLDSRLSQKSTSIIKEGSNLYYTQSRSLTYLNNNLNNLNTSIFTTGSNLYYTKTLINNDFDIRLNNISSSSLNEGSNLYYKSQYIYNDFNPLFITKTTTDLSVGSNLYYTTDNYNKDFDNILSSNYTSVIKEGSNLYYTFERTFNELTSNFNIIDILNTSKLQEGSNLYYTQLRTTNDLNNLLISNNTSIITEGSNLYYKTYLLQDSFSSNFNNISTTNINEGSNLYYTLSNTLTYINNRLSFKTTSDLPEGSNLYYTNDRFDIIYNISKTKKLNLSLNSTSELIEGSNLYYNDTYVDLYILSNTENIKDLSTNNIIEGSNLYYNINSVETILSSNFNNINTSKLYQGSNLYYNDNRFNLISTDNITEGINNKFIINNTYNSNITVNGILTINVLNILDIDLINSSNISSNILYTDEKVINAFNKSISYSTNNIIEGSSNKYYTYNNTYTDFNNILLSKSTDILSQLSNIYYDSNLIINDLEKIFNINNIINEGTSNYYYNNIRVFDIIHSLNTDQLSQGTSNIYLNKSILYDIINTKTTDDIINGSSNMYYNDSIVSYQFNRLYNSSNENGNKVSGWNNTTLINKGFKCNTPFYLALYLSQNIQSGYSNIPFEIPFEIDYNSIGNMKNSVLMSSNYWYNNHYIAPVKGIYSINYSLITDTIGYTWLNKNTDINQSYSKKFISHINTPIISSINLFAKNTIDEYSFLYKPLSDNSYIYNNLVNNNIGNTKASILLLQEIN